MHKPNAQAKGGASYRVLVGTLRGLLSLSNTSGSGPSPALLAAAGVAAAADDADRPPAFAPDFGRRGPGPCRWTLTRSLRQISSISVRSRSSCTEDFAGQQ